MAPAAVLAVAVRQIVGPGVKALVPKVIGQAAAALQMKGGSSRLGKRRGDEAAFFAELEARRVLEVAMVARTSSTGRSTSRLDAMVRAVAHTVAR